jgi:hypothetical protein
LEPQAIAPVATLDSNNAGSRETARLSQSDAPAGDSHFAAQSGKPSVNNHLGFLCAADNLEIAQKLNASRRLKT